MVWEWFLCTDYLEEVGIRLNEGVVFLDVFISVLPITPLWMSNFLQLWLNVFLLHSHNRRLDLIFFLSLNPFCHIRLMILIVIFFIDSCTKHSLFFISSIFLLLFLDYVIVHFAPKIRY